MRSQTEFKSCPTAQSAKEYLPKNISLSTLREAAKTCHGCDLHCNATQTVFGEGSIHATIMLVGEQPGDQEDRAGRPFVGPAGAVLDQALTQADIARDDLYITNAVKHFRFVARGKRRVHTKPSARHIKACRPWLEAEIHVIHPHIIVALGATAAQALMGSSFRLTQRRGEFLKDTEWAPNFIATIHPSSLLRIPDEEMRRRAKAEFFADFGLIGDRLRRP